MAYHLLVAESPSSVEFQFDHYLGSAQSVQYFWEAVGEILNLPIISSLTENADDESGLVLSGERLVEFRREVEVINNYWLSKSVSNELPENFLESINGILNAINHTIEKDMVIIIG